VLFGASVPQTLNILIGKKIFHSTKEIEQSNATIPQERN
jgi:hypothetical protein